MYHGSRTGANIRIFDTPPFISDNREIAGMFRREAEYILDINGEQVVIDSATADEIAPFLTHFFVR